MPQRARASAATICRCVASDSGETHGESAGAGDVAREGDDVDEERAVARRAEARVREEIYDVDASAYASPAFLPPLPAFTFAFFACLPAL